MPSPSSVITVNGKAELPLGTKEYTAALTAEATSGTFQSDLESTAKLPDTAKEHSGESQDMPHTAAQPLYGTQTHLAFSV